MKKYFGKYRGKVESNLDPQKQARLQVSVPAIFGSDKLSWAMPAVPYAGKGVGLVLIPENGTNVWIEFEGGDIDYPIWTGCFWATGELPTEVVTPDVKLLKTKGITVMLSDQSGAGGVTIEAKSPAVSKPLTFKLDKQGLTITDSSANIKLSQQGIELSLGSQAIKISAKSVAINNGALEVM